MWYIYGCHVSCANITHLRFSLDEPQRGQVAGVVRFIQLMLLRQQLRRLRMCGTGNDGKDGRAQQRARETEGRVGVVHQGILSVPGRGSGRGPAGKGLRRT